MSMVRDPVFHVGDPSHNLIPAAGGAVWYPLHDSLLLPGIAGLPSLTELGTPSGSKWSVAGMYTLPAVNTNCALNAVDDAEDLFLNSQLSLYGMAVGEHRIIVMDASYLAAPAAQSMLWSYGLNNSNATLFGLAIDGAEAVKFVHRAKNAGGATNASTTAMSGTFAAFRNQGIFTTVLGIRVVSASVIDVEMRMGNGTLSAHYAASGIDVTAGGTAPPGISGGITVALHGGLRLGGRGVTGGGADNCWGSGTGNGGAVGNFSARKFSSYSSSRVADTLATVLARKRDYPRNLSADFQ